MKIAILTANLGNFDTQVKDPVEQFFRIDGESTSIPIDTFHRFTDKDFPPITGLAPRLQYRIPKMFGWEMFPGYDIYIWLDAAMSFEREDSVEWFLEQLGDADMAFFKHPWRKTIKEEVDHIEDHLQREKPYIVSRYKNGLHKEHYKRISEDKTYKDDTLFASTAFIYRNNLPARETLRSWWALQSRYYTCDQVALPYAIHMARPRVNTIEENVFKCKYISLVSPHK